MRAVDPLGVRRLEFGPDELKREFPCAPDALFSPRRVALVGASDRTGTLGNLLAANLAVVPRARWCRCGSRGSRCATCDGEIDLAVVAVPAHAVPAVAADAAAKGVAAMVVLSGGFAETGPDGAELQEELVANAGRRAGGRAELLRASRTATCR